MTMTNRPVSRQPLPSGAKRVFQGALFDVYQWNQLQFDGSYATFEKLSRPDTAYVLPVLDDGRVLIARQEQPGSAPYFGLIGGRVDPPEAPEAAARRELLEEAGLTGGHLRLWDSFQFLPKIDWAIYIYVAHDCISSGQSLDSGEKIELVAQTFDDLLELAATEQFGDVEIALHLLRVAADESRFTNLRSLLTK